MYDYGYWNPLPDDIQGVTAGIGKRMQQLSSADPQFLPNLHASPTLFITSDYSGEHAGADYQVISFMITDIHAVETWNRGRITLRKRYLADGRRMSFKQLRDQRRWQALLPFLAAADKLNGICVVVAVHSSIDTLFTGSAPLDWSNPAFAKFAHWNTRALEKLFRVCHFVSVFLAGLSRDGQHVLWITDDDSIAPNVQGLYDLTELFGTIATQYLAHDLGHLRVGTPARSDTNDRLLEDLVAVPDLAAGAVAELLTAHAGNTEIIITSPASVYLSIGPALSNATLPQSKSFEVYRGSLNKVMAHEADMSAKSAFIAKWLGTKDQALRKVVCMIDPAPGGEDLALKWLRFYDGTQ